MTDPESIQAFVNSKPKAARSFWQKLRNAFKQLRKKIDGTSAAEKKILRRMSTAERLWADAFQAASERANGVQQTSSKRVKTKARKPETTKSLTEKSRKNMRYSAKKKAAKNGSSYDFTKSFAQQIDDWIAGNFPERDNLMIGGTPQVFQNIGFNALPMTIDQTHVGYAINGTKNADHTIGEKMLKQLPQAMEHPVAVITSATQTNTSVVALLPFTHNGNTVIAPVVIDGYAKQNNVLLDSNAVTSIHGRSNAIVKLLADALNNYANGQNTLFYWNKKQAIALLQKTRVVMPKDSAQIHDGYIASIRDAGSPVKPKLKNVTESVQFKRWFGNWIGNPEKASKIVNADGSPKIVYYKAEDAHGNIHLLDTENGGEAVYLNMRNPYRVKQKPNAQAEAQLIQYAKSEGYDGIIIPDSTSERYITFKQENIKSVDNVGTFDRGNADIRYSVKKKAANAGGYDFSKSFAQQIDDWIAGRFPKGDALVLGDTPEVLQKIGLDNLPMTINQKHIDYVLNGTKDAGHAFGADVLKQIPAALQNPIAVITSETQADTSIVMLLPLTFKRKQIIAPVFINGKSRQNGIVINVNTVKSVFAKDNAISKLLSNAIINETNGDASIFYWNKEKATALLQQARNLMSKSTALMPQVRTASAAAANISDGYVHSIYDEGSPVKARYSIMKSRSAQS